MDPPGYRYDPRLSPLNSWWSLGEAKGSLWFTLNRWRFEVGGVAYTVGYTHVMLNTVLHASLGGCGMACASVRRVLSVCLFVCLFGEALLTIILYLVKSSNSPTLQASTLQCPK